VFVKDGPSEAALTHAIDRRASVVFVSSKIMLEVVPNQSSCDAARIVAAVDAGALPVGEDNPLRGMMTGRDMVICAAGWGEGPMARSQGTGVGNRSYEYCHDDGYEPSFRFGGGADIVIAAIMVRETLGQR
jgi:hypothetical protein